MTQVYASIGSNIDREHNVRAAVSTLRARYGALTVSPVYETAAVGFDGDAFYNLVVGFDTDASPEALTADFHAIEAENGRRRGGARYASRTLDIDLLTWGGEPYRGDGVTLPRAEILEQAFVLGPLADIAPNTRHPEDGRTYAELWAAFGPGGEGLRRLNLDLD